MLAHPANCQLLIHSDNIRKHAKLGMSVEELKSRIKNWDVKYNHENS